MTILEVLGRGLLMVVFVAPLIEPMFLVAMGLGVDRAAIAMTPKGVAFRSFDGIPLGISFALCAIALVVAASWPATTKLQVVAAGLVAVVLCAGCRVAVHVQPGREQLTRYVLYVVPWKRRPLTGARAWEDGWGDFMDPEALHVGDANTSVEVGWGMAGSADRTGRTARLFTKLASTVRAEGAPTSSMKQSKTSNRLTKSRAPAAIVGRQP